MRRRLLWLALAVVAVVVVLAVVAALTTQPDLSDHRDQVDRAWAPLRAPLVMRYQALGAVLVALDGAGAQGRTVTKDLTAALTRWQRVARVDDPATQAPLANDLEALAARAQANVAASDRLNANATVSAALQAFHKTLVNPPAVAAYNRAVRSYQHARTGTIRRLVADALGFDARPQLVLGP
jgi:hypothetical protein